MGVVHLILIFMTAKDVVTLFGGYLEATLTAAIIYRPKVSVDCCCYMPAVVEQ